MPAVTVLKAKLELDTQLAKDMMVETEMEEMPVVEEEVAVKRVQTDQLVLVVLVGMVSKTQSLVPQSTMVAVAVEEQEILLMAQLVRAEMAVEEQALKMEILEQPELQIQEEVVEVEDIEILALF